MGVSRSKKIVATADRADLMHSPELTTMLLDGFNLSGIIVLDADRAVVYVSPKASQALEVVAEDLLGKNFTEAVPLLDSRGDVIPEERRPSFRALSGTSVQATLFFCQYRIPATGVLISLAVRAAAIRRTETVIGAVVELRRAQPQLDVGGMKSMFTAFAAHQLKTPSSIVKGFLELMIRQGKRAYKDEQWNFLMSAFDANERLIRLSRTLLNITRLEGGMVELALARTDIRTLLKERIKNYTVGTVGRVRITAAYTGDVTNVLTDGTFVAEIVDVLLNNAYKVAPEGSTIAVSAHATAEAGVLEIVVADEGPGFPPEILAKLRGPLAMHQPQSGVAGGNGLGLYMARKYAALLNGDIQAENLLPRGSKVTVRIPLLPESA